MTDLNTEFSCRDYTGQNLGFQVSADGKKVWVCINGICVLRCKDLSFVSVTDERNNERYNKD